MSNTNNRLGIVLMILSMAAFAITDALIKISAGTISPAHTAFYIIAGGLIVFASIALAKGERLIDPIALTPILLIRYVAEIVGTFCIVLAVSRVPLSTVGAILQAAPLIVAAGAVVFLKERVSWRRWSAIGIGFVGVLLIIRPTSAAFDANVLWALLAMLGLSTRDLTTRATPDGLSSTRLATYTMAAALPFSIVWVLLSQSSLLATDANWLLVLGMIGFAALGYMLIIASIRTAEVSIVSPFRYSRLLFLLLLGILFFEERPDLPTLAGAAIIVLSGVYTMWRDRITRMSH